MGKATLIKPLGSLGKILLLGVLLYAGGVSAARPSMHPDAQGDVDAQKQAMLQKISLEKIRIANDYKSADSRLFNLIDSITEFIEQQPTRKEMQLLYLTRLQIFLANINRYYSDSYLKSGTYLAALSYYPEMILWDEQEELLGNLKRYSAFSIKAAKLIPSDAVAEDFLLDYVKDYPDDAFRYAEEFEDRRFALRILERAVRIAPESAKRYYATGNTVSDILSHSHDLFFKKSVDMFSFFGQRSHSYLLLDAVVTNNMPLATADSIASRPEVLFRFLVQRTSKYDVSFNYSVNRFLEDYCIDAMRKINRDALNPGYDFESFKRRTPEEMFTMLTYGHRETTIKTFQTLMDILVKKLNGAPVNSVLLISLDKTKLKPFVIYCSKNKTLFQLLAMADDDRKQYLLTLPGEPEKANPMPPFMVFGHEPIPAAPDDKSLSDIAPASPPKPVAPETNIDTLTAPTLSPAAVEVTAPKNDVVKAPEPPVRDTMILMHTIYTTKALASSSVTKEEPVKLKLIDYVPPPIIEKVEPVTIALDERTKNIVSLKKNILQAIQNIPSFINTDYAEEILLYAAQKEPDELFKKVNVFKGKTFCRKVLEQCAINAPVSVKRYLYNPALPVNYILQYSQNPVVKKILEINEHIGYASKPYLLLDDIVSGKMTVKDALAISNNPVKLYSAVVSIISRPKYLGKYSIDHEMRDYSLRFVREINDKIATGASQPFSSVEDFSAADLYFIMLYGRDEVFTSTFNGLFNRFMLKLPKENGAVFFQSINHNQFRDFLSLCCTYATIEEFLTRFSPNDKQQLLVKYISGLEKEKDDLSTIVLIAEAISNLSNNQLLSVLQTNIKSEYERVKASNNQFGISIYGVLSSMISGNARVEPVWYKRVSQQFRISPVNSLASTALFGTTADCIEQVYFYNDDDGRSSFVNFMKTYKGQPTWGIEDKNSYVRIFSKSGMHVEIFANKPEVEETGINAITQYLHEKNLSPTVVVHRGHSFHTEATLEKITASTRLIFLGSCGGFYKLSIALENAPDAHVISTKQIGTKSVNDVMLLALNENIRTGKDIEWNEFWDKMRDKLGNNQYFSDYVPPHKNLEAIFIRAYYKILGV